MANTGLTFDAKYDPPDSEKRKDAMIAVYYVVILIFIGIPMWFLTTSTYRASLPLNEIEEFSKSKFSVVIKLNVICFEPIAELNDIIDFEDKLFNSLRSNHSFNDRSVSFKYHGYVRPASTKEWQAQNNGKTMSEIELLTTIDGSDAIYVLILPRNTMLLSSGQDGLVRSKSEKSVIYLKMAPWEKMRLVIVSLVTNLMAPNNYVNHVYKAVSEIPTKEKFDKIPIKIRSLFTRVRTEANYDWTFSLVVPSPVGGPEPEWNFARLQNLYLEPLTKKLSQYLNIKISSQIIYGVHLDRLWPWRQVTPREGVYSTEDLTHVVNGLENYLGSSGNTHFVACLVSGPGQPQVHVEQWPGTRSKLDAFTVPRWGGLVLVNNSSMVLDGDHIMRVFLPQIRSLMGLTKTDGGGGGGGGSLLWPPMEETDDGTGVAMWQLNNWLRERTIENVAISQVTLHSVADLLDKVVNMVIRDDVAASIRAALHLSQTAMSALDDRSLHDGLRRAFVSSKQALAAAEAAFFHPSLLELLYFQEDQKYGIYIPLFVPVLLPLFLAALKIRPYLSRPSKHKPD